MAKRNKEKVKSIAFLPSRNLLALSNVRSCLLTSFSLSPILNRMAPCACPSSSLPRSLVTSSFLPTSGPTWLPSPGRWSMEGRGWTRSDDSPSADCGYCVGKPRGTVSLLQPCSLRHTRIHTRAEWKKSGVRFFHSCESFRFVSFRFVSCRFVSSGRSRGLGDRSTVVSSPWCLSLVVRPSSVSFSSSAPLPTYVRCLATPVVRLCSPLSHPRAASCDRTSCNQWICRGVQCSFVVSPSVSSTAGRVLIFASVSSLRGVLCLRGTRSAPRDRRGDLRMTLPRLESFRSLVSELHSKLDFIGDAPRGSSMLACA